MKKHRILILGLALLFALVSMAQAVEMKLPKIEKTTLDNGLDVYVIEQHEVPIVSMRLVIPGGSIYNDEETAGLANLTAGLSQQAQQAHLRQAALRGHTTLHRHTGD